MADGFLSSKIDASTWLTPTILSAVATKQKCYQSSRLHCNDQILSGLANGTLGSLQLNFSYDPNPLNATPILNSVSFQAEFARASLGSNERPSSGKHPRFESMVRLTSNVATRKPASPLARATKMRADDVIACPRYGIQIYRIRTGVDLQRSAADKNGAISSNARLPQSSLTHVEIITSKGPLDASVLDYRYSS